ncbi:hypothetical protein HD806DRAFT_535924 [Xylariaceae sp. AK1471]|nr:hypothetical protein HD806DRAFT_535924 [Xylariaceae sp. AK1471]
MAMQLGGLTFADTKAQRDSQTRPLFLHRHTVFSPRVEARRPDSPKSEAKEQRPHQDVANRENGYMFKKHKMWLCITVLADTSISVSSSGSKTRPLASESCDPSLKHAAEAGSSSSSRLGGFDAAGGYLRSHRRLWLNIMEEEITIIATVHFNSLNTVNGGIIMTVSVVKISNSVTTT